ncbi:MAG TPA: type VI secretion system tube protein Hcp [Bryobacteraceae bacterium]|nr:type VI secretion system tube protein Hcp [Bryobacteraceae bacterium]
MAMYLDVMAPAIAGESQSPNQKWNQKIQLETMNYTISQTPSGSVGTGMVAGGARFGAMTITKVMDKSTPLLWSYLCSGDPLSNMAIRVSRAGSAGGPFEAETYLMENVIVSSYHTSGAPGAGGLPEETWSLAFTKITETYQSVDPKGALQPPQQSGFDVGAGTEYRSPAA